MIPIDQQFLKTCEKFDPSISAEAYCLTVKRYIRMIWDDSQFPEKELTEMQDALIACYISRTPVSKAASQIINRIQEAAANPVTEAVLDELFRRVAKQREKLSKSDKNVRRGKKK